MRSPFVPFRLTPSARVLLYFGVVVIAYAGVSFTADAYMGQKLIEWVVNTFVLGIGIASILLALGASIFRPDMAKTALYVGLVCAAIFLVVKLAPALQSALRAG